MKVRFSTVLITIVIVMVAAAIEWFRQISGFPVTLLDLILTPLFLVFSFYMLRELNFLRRRSSKISQMQPSTFGQWLLTVLGMVLLLVLALVAIWHGVSEPLLFMSGVKGSMHGYTLAALGVCLLLICVLALWSLIKR